MKTDELIDMLGTNIEPVKRGQLRNVLLIALAVGALAAFCLMLATLGVPANALRGQDFPLELLALAFTLGTAATGARFLGRAARPGESGRKPLILIGLLFSAVLSAGAVTLADAPPAARGMMVFGPQWVTCLICIPLFAVVPYLALIWALRKGAPTNLVITGAVAGLVAGALGAAACVFHHPDCSIPFIVLWFAGPILLCAVAGAMLGPRLLRW
jgi:hypothetical protein